MLFHHLFENQGLYSEHLIFFVAYKANKVDLHYINEKGMLGTNTQAYELHL